MDDNKSVTDVVDGASEYEESVEEAIDRLAKLSPVEYERVRKDEAAKLGISRISVLDKLVESARPNETKNGQGRAINLPEPEPWPEPVDGDDLLDQIVRALRRFLALPEGVAEAIALWAVNSYCLDVAQIMPRLAITSPEKRCGKTTALTIIGWLVPRPLMASNIKPAAIFRTIEAAQPTLLLDEADTFMTGDNEMNGVINSGHNRAAAFVIRTVGEDHEPRQFSTWAPMVIACIGRLPSTLEDRSIPVQMRRRRADEVVDRLRFKHEAVFAPLARMASRWAADKRTVLADADPSVPESLHDRAADNWRPLIAIADLAGGEWPARARRVAVLLSDGGEDTSAKTQLLADMREIIGDRDKIPSKELTNSLVEMEDRQWSDWYGKPITPAKIARLLKPFNVSPLTIRLGSGGTIKGYTKEGLNDAFTRYLPSQNVTTSQGNEAAGYSDFQSVTREADVTLSNPLKANDFAGCDVVTFWNGGKGDTDTVLVSNCVHCGQPITPNQETVSHRDGEIHMHCMDDWQASLPPRAGDNWEH